MAKQTIDFAKLIQEDREQRQQQHWQGTFLEYLELVKADPGLAKSAHRRLYDMIIEAGVSELNPENDPRVQRLYRGRADQGLQLLQGRVLRDRADARQDRALLPLGGDGGRGEPPGALPDGPGRLRQELAGRAPEARPRGAAADLRDRRLPDARRAAAPDAAPSAAGVREDARRQDRGRSLPGLPLPPDERVRRPLRGGAGPHHVLLQARAARHRRRAAGRSEQPGHLGPDRLRGHLQARPLLRGRPARARAERRVQRRQPRHGRVHRGLQERDRVPAHHDHRDPGEVRPGARSPRHGVRRHLHRRALERGGVAEVQGRPHQRGDPRPHRGGEGALQPPPLGRGQDLPEDHPALELRRPHRAAHARDRLDVRDPLAARADRQVRPDDQAPAVQRRGGGREGPDQEDRRASCATTPSARA